MYTTQNVRCHLASTEGYPTVAKMPELPEVQTITSMLIPLVEDKIVTDVDVQPNPRFDQATDIIGQTFTRPYRKGKWILIPTQGGKELVVHLGMTGSLAVSDEPVDLVRPVRVIFSLEDKDCTSTFLCFSDIRGFARLAVVEKGGYGQLPGLDTLGPELLAPNLNVDRLAKKVVSSNAKIKSVLLDQKVFAGVGNIYADEALHAAGIHPEDTNLSQAKACILIDKVIEVLQKSLSYKGTTFRDYKTVDGTKGSFQEHLTCYGRYGQPCYGCGSALEKTSVAGRTSTFCPECQKLSVSS